MSKSLKTFHLKSLRNTPSERSMRGETWNYDRQTDCEPNNQVTDQPSDRRTWGVIEKFHFRERKELGCEFGFLNSTFYREIPYWNVFLRLLEMIWRYFLLRSSHCVCGTMMPSFRCGILENIVDWDNVFAELWCQDSDVAL